MAVVGETFADRAGSDVRRRADANSDTGGAPRQRLPGDDGVVLGPDGRRRFSISVDWFSSSDRYRISIILRNSVARPAVHVAPYGDIICIIFFLIPIENRQKPSRRRSNAVNRSRTRRDN